MERTHFAVVVVVLMAGCSSAPRPPAMDVLAELRATHPGGMPIDDARKLMEDAGFTCQYIANGKFVHEVNDDAAPMLRRIPYENIEFLLCKREQTSGLVRFWEDSALVVENGVIVSVLSNYNAVGP